MSADRTPHTREAIDALMVKAFHPGREARSKEYKHGARAMLNNRLAGVPFPHLPYAVGSAAADAYFAGQDEGRSIVSAERAAQAERGAA